MYSEGRMGAGCIGKVNPVKSKTEIDSHTVCVVLDLPFQQKLNVTQELKIKKTRRKAEILLILMHKLEEQKKEDLETLRK